MLSQRNSFKLTINVSPLKSLWNSKLLEINFACQLVTRIESVEHTTTQIYNLTCLAPKPKLVFDCFLTAITQYHFPSCTAVLKKRVKYISDFDFSPILESFIWLYKSQSGDAARESKMLFFLGQEMSFMVKLQGIGIIFPFTAQPGRVLFSTHNLASGKPSLPISHKKKRDYVRMAKSILDFVVIIQHYCSKAFLDILRK